MLGFVTTPSTGGGPVERRYPGQAVEVVAMRDTWGTGRMEAFSDAVFSIAATLLVLDIVVPASQFDNLWLGIAHQWPSYLGFVTSFATIGGLWFVHHALFRRLRWADTTLMQLNLLLLLAVAFLPFPTTLIAEAIHEKSPERAAVVFYGVSLLVISLLIAVMWRYVTGHRELLEPDVTDEEIEAIQGATTPSVAFYGAVIAIAIVAPRVAAGLYLLIPIVSILRTRSWHTPGDTSADPG